MILILLSVILQALGGMFMKMAAMQLQDFELLKFIVNPFVILAILSFGLQGIFWQLALKKHNLSYAYYFTSLRFILTLAIGFFVFSEAVNVIHLAGVAIIVAGLIVFMKRGEANA